MTDLLVIGGGAAGLMAAGAARARGLAVTVLEHNARGPGRKLLLTGKGRCNLTSDCEPRDFLAFVRRNPRFLYSALAAFPPRAAMELFESLGVPLKTERGRRVFPRSDRAADVLAALRAYAAGSTFVPAHADALLLEGGRCAGAAAAGRPYRAAATLLCTGGISYPATGSDGSGYRLAEQAGHTVVPPQPCLCALKSPDPDCPRMAGLSLRNVRLTLLRDEKPLFAEQGEALFTHFGLSGPLVLTASSYVEDMAAHRYACELDLKPALDEKALYDRLTRDAAALGARRAAALLDTLLPRSMRAPALGRWGIGAGMAAAQLTKGHKLALVRLLKHWRVEVCGLGDAEHAVITAGGVDVRGVDPKTMRSRLCRDLCFAGEVLDVDARTGGYNLHIAWCTAQAAVRGLTQKGEAFP